MCEDYNDYRAHPWSPFPVRRAHPGQGPHTSASQFLGAPGLLCLFVYLQPRIAWSTSLWDLNSSPRRNYCTFCKVVILTLNPTTRWTTEFLSNAFLEAKRLGWNTGRAVSVARPWGALSHCLTILNLTCWVRGYLAHKKQLHPLGPA